MANNNLNNSAFPFEPHSLFEPGLTKLEYALIHCAWEPSKDDIEMQYTRDKLANPYNDSRKPNLRSHFEIVRDLKIKYLKTLLS